jgi:hypothetical protein
MDRHSELLCLLDGAVGSGLGIGIELLHLSQHLLRVTIAVVDGSL